MKHDGSQAQGPILDFQLHSLGWFQFQRLVETIFRTIVGQTFQSFADTNDAGRDGAFQGTWTPEEGYTHSGSFTVQCKFTANPSATMSFATLKDDLSKARRLARKGLADIYYLVTNARLTAEMEAAIKAKLESIPGIKWAACFGKEWICRVIAENPSLRSLVPRIYGLGDLSQILDQRVYRQAQEILTAFGPDLSRFVVTEAHRKSVEALNEQGLVLLLGEPASGKSTIAMALALAAADSWRSKIVKIRDAAHFEQHWNPDEPLQYFWVDDVFGATQLEKARLEDWNRALMHVSAALKRNTKFVFTSRDYIFKAAEPLVRPTTCPTFLSSKVRIELDRLSDVEKRQILYNHLRHGGQPQSFRTTVKPWLEKVAQQSGFLPESARRLGTPAFTRGLVLTEGNLLDFFARPTQWLQETIGALDDNSKAALVMLFMRGGRRASPVSLDEADRTALTLYNGTEGGARAALQSLDDTFVKRATENGTQYWTFRHPTIRDALSSLVATNPELCDIYVAGAPLATLLTEIVCGNVALENARVVVPPSRFTLVLKRLNEAILDPRFSKLSVHSFLVSRCDQEFMRQFCDCYKDYVSALKIGPFVRANFTFQLAITLNEMGMLSPELRAQHVSQIVRCSVDNPEGDVFEIPGAKSLFTEEEWSELEARIATEVIEEYAQVVRDWSTSVSKHDDPDETAEGLRETFRIYRDHFDGPLSDLCHRALSLIEEIVEDLSIRRADFLQEMAQDYGEDSAPPPERSIFDDVDL